MIYKMLSKKWLISLALIGSFLIAGGVTRAQDVALPQAGFVAYSCDFLAATNSGQIRAALFGTTGTAIPLDAFQVSVTATDSGQAAAPEQVTVELVGNRPPLELVLVLDITETVPIDNIVNAISTRLIPQLNAEDEVALITFSEDVSAPTQFYTDKNRLVNEHMLGLLSPGGDNRLYDATLEAVSALPFNSDRRQAVLVITDSGRRALTQAPLELIISDAAEAEIQIFSIGFFSQDTPDVASLLRLANGTQGYSWIYDGADRTRAGLEAAVGDLLVDFARTTSSEALITVDLQGVVPDSSGRVLFDVTLDTNNDSTLSDTVSCPVQQLRHSINFIEGLSDATISGSIDIGVNVDTDLSFDATTVVFRLNNEIVLNSASQVFTFDAETLPPGLYEVGAQLTDLNGAVLATVPTALRLYAQRRLQLEALTDLSAGISETMGFAAQRPTDVSAPSARFLIARASAPQDERQLGGGDVAFGEDGRAVLTLDGMPDLVRGLFPEIAEEDSLRVRAIVPGVPESEPALAVSDVLMFEARVAVAAATPVSEVDVEIDAVLLPASIVFLAAFNLLMLRWVGRLRIRRLINKPDRAEMSSQVMSITVRREGRTQTHTLTKKTMTVGRGASNDINLGDDAKISRQHAVVMWRREKWYFTNRKPDAKARIDSKTFKGYALKRLEPITEIQIGDALLVFHSSAQRDIAEFIKTNL